ncbi:MAG: hypothetical protein V2L15_02595, partial [Desulfobacteraceae bacterium]|nr:hypothetical protein [Desulfobacteraceae bacterium]
MGVFENRVARFVCQIYEIQTPAEAEALAAMGVDRIGTVLMADDAPSNRQVGETIAAARRVGACSSLIPLFSEPARIMAALAELQPDIVHFCEALGPDPDADMTIGPLIALQREVRRRFPVIRIMRSIPIGPPGRADRV